MVFIDPISDFINRHAEMKVLALTFIVAIGALLVVESFGLETHIELLGVPLEKLMVYFAMVFAVVLELIQMRYNGNLARYRAEQAAGPLADLEAAQAPAKAEEASQEGAERAAAGPDAPAPGAEPAERP